MVAALCVGSRHLLTGGCAVVRWHRQPENDIVPVIIFPPTREMIEEIAKPMGTQCAGLYYIPQNPPKPSVGFVEYQTGRKNMQ